MESSEEKESEVAKVNKDDSTLHGISLPNADFDENDEFYRDVVTFL